MHAPDILREELVNDFEGPVFARYPAIGAVKDAMLARGAAYTSMSGSGSSVYGFFSDIATARDVGAYFVSLGYRISLTPPHFTV
jgi:4-diphosphocytidyl-2-C-methyl-D-erythritol kinase